VHQPTRVPGSDAGSPKRSSHLTAITISLVIVGLVFAVLAVVGGADAVTAFAAAVGALVAVLELVRQLTKKK
jgi:hypothetical protein